MTTSARTIQPGRVSSMPASAREAALREEDTMPATPYTALVAAHAAACAERARGWRVVWRMVMRCARLVNAWRRARRARGDRWRLV